MTKIMRNWRVTRTRDGAQREVVAHLAFDAVEQSGLGPFSECTAEQLLGPQEFIPHAPDPLPFDDEDQALADSDFCEGAGLLSDGDELHKYAAEGWEQTGTPWPPKTGDGDELDTVLRLSRRLTRAVRGLRSEVDTLRQRDALGNEERAALLAENRELRVELDRLRSAPTMPPSGYEPTEETDGSD